MKHVLSGNCRAVRVVYNCRDCGIGEQCDVCHLHDEPRGDCTECEACARCDAEDVQ